MIRRELWNSVLASVIIAVGAAAAHAQGFGRGGLPTTEESFSRIDRNGSGAIEPEEWETLPAPIRRLYEDLADLSVPMDYDDFAEVSQKMREQMMSRFGGGRGLEFGRGGGSGDFERRDRSRDDYDDGDRRSDDGGSRRSRGGFGGGRGFGGADDESSSTTGSADKKAEKTSGKVAKPRTPINLKLPEQYRARDKDRDGQIGLYEWSRSDYAGFQKLDRNGDGFLTPQELLRAGGGTSSASPKSENGVSTSSKDSETTNSAAAAAPAPKSAADTAFNLIDKDKDGSISEVEWGKSILASKKFKDAGIEVRFPLSRARFQEEYPKAYQTTGN